MEEATGPGVMQVAMTDGLVQCVDVNGVSCKLCIHGPGSSNGSIPGLVGKISADPNTVRNVTSESMDNSCIMA